MPELRPEEQWYWNAFWQMSASRAIGMTVGPIPLSEILAYCLLYGVDSYEERDDLVYVIAKVDQAYLELTRESSPKKGK